MSALPPMQSLWIGPRLSALERLCMQSFLDHGHAFHLYAYEDIAGVPPGVTVKDARDILPEREVYRDLNGLLTPFSNWFRWELLCRLGGWWVDADIVCLRPFDFADEFLCAQELPGVVNNAVLRAPPGHPLIARLRFLSRRPEWLIPLWEKGWRRNLAAVRGTFRAAFARDFRRTLRRLQGRANGRRALHRLLTINESLIDAAPPYYFYPVPWWQWATQWDGAYAGRLHLFDGCYAMHFWAQMRRWHKEAASRPVHPDSLFAQLWRRHFGDETGMLEGLLPKGPPEQQLEPQAVVGA